MPELFSRMDDLNWLTPSAADILDQGAPPPGGDGSIRERMLMIQHELDELDTPARIVNVRSTPSYTLYIAKLGTIGQTNNRRVISPNEIKDSLKTIAENHKDWLLGFIPQLRQDDSAIGILLRTSEHRPISLRRLLVRSQFRKHESTFSFVLGVTLEQQMLIENLANVGHILVVGNDNAKQHFIRSSLLTMVMLNTPSELRVAIAGASSDAYKYLIGAPHALGRVLASPSDGQRLMDGLVKEIQRRKQSISDENATNIEDFNTKTANSNKPRIPRILLILDALTDENWQENKDLWEQSLTTLLTEGANVGIHVIFTVDDETRLSLPQSAINQIKLKVITRASSKDISTSIPDFHASLLRFVDAFITYPQSRKSEITPVELCAISNAEIKKVVEYWRQMSKQRFQEIQVAKTGGQTGVTSILNADKVETQEQNIPPAPPTPETPSVATLTRATQKLGAELATMVVEIDEEETVEIAQLVKEEIIPQVTTEVEPVVADNPVVENQTEVSMVSEKLFWQSIALSAYLGWISRGALCDVLDLTSDEADQLLAKLKAEEFVEDAEYPVLRFTKLSQFDN